jgi:phenylpropionate dioxygenase-like ring-hydroxylating dioxygenase large terminal subunit
MYPLKAERPWPFNQWYVAAFSREVEKEILGRRYLNKDVILFRDERGTAHALSGICPHRMLPLKMGSLSVGRMSCAYRGLTFDSNGDCIAAPTSKRLPPCRLIKYPLMEVGPLLWIWIGEPAAAHETALPKQASIGIGAEGWRTDLTAHFDLKARYTILIDNLFDLSHLNFVHASILGRSVVARQVTNVPTDTFHRFLYPAIGDFMSRRLETELLGVGLINAGGPTWNGVVEEHSRLGRLHFIHAVTPASESTSHYWVFLARDFRLDDEELSGALMAQERAVVQQDVDTLQATRIPWGRLQACLRRFQCYQMRAVCAHGSTLSR